MKKKKKKNKHKHKHKSERREREESSRSHTGHIVHAGLPVVDTMPELSEPSSPEIDDV